jgi:glycosyltransferase involved in cell wall biosynthesis
MRLIGRSNGPNEVLKSLSKYAVLVRKRKLDQIPESHSIWVPDNELNFIKYGEMNTLKTRRLILGPNVRQYEPELSSIFLGHPTSVAVVPSDSMKEILIAIDNRFANEDVEVWPAGIDVEYWRPNNSEKSLVPIYIKGATTQSHIVEIEGYIRQHGFETAILRYGEYKQKQYRKILRKSAFIIWIGHTETQGIAQFQAWSMNVPTLVSNLPAETLSGERGELVSPAPFLTESTGMISRSRMISPIELFEFIRNLDSYSPRNWVLENASQKRAFEKFMKIYTLDDNQ